MKTDKERIINVDRSLQFQEVIDEMKRIGKLSKSKKISDSDDDIRNKNEDLTPPK